MQCINHNGFLTTQIYYCYMYKKTNTKMKMNFKDRTGRNEFDKLTQINSIPLQIWLNKMGYQVYCHLLDCPKSNQHRLRSGSLILADSKWLTIHQTLQSLVRPSFNIPLFNLYWQIYPDMDRCVGKLSSQKISFFCIKATFKFCPCLLSKKIV